MTFTSGLRIGLVGYGSAGRGIHARLIREAGLAVSAVVVRDSGRAQSAREDWPGVRIFADLNAMLASADHLDLVVVASPSGLHVEHALAVIASGTALVLDKPIAPSAEGAATIIEAASAAGVPLSVFQNRRWDEEQLTLRALLARGDLGQVHRFERRWERWRPEPMDRWKENDPVGGGLLLDLGAHLVDSAVECFGPVTSVYAEMRSLNTPTEDDVFLSLTHERPALGDPGMDAGGVTSHLWAGTLVAAPGPRTRVLGREGAYLVTTFEQDVSPFARLAESAPAGSLGWIVRGDEMEPVPQAPGGHVDFYRDVIAWLTLGARAPVDPRDALHTALVLDCARESVKTGARVAVNTPIETGQSHG